MRRLFVFIWILCLGIPSLSYADYQGEYVEVSFSLSGGAHFEGTVDAWAGSREEAEEIGKARIGESRWEDEIWIVGRVKLEVSIQVKWHGETRTLRNDSFQIRRNSQSAITSIANDLNEWYNELAYVESEIATTYTEIDQFLSPGYDKYDKSHPGLMDRLAALKKEKAYIESQITQTEADLIGEQGSGALGWYFFN